jgi:hypothetical protein
MKTKVLGIVIVLIALGIAVAATILPLEQLHFIIRISRFFEVMIPILAVGALLKYLLCCKSEH